MVIIRSKTREQFPLLKPAHREYPKRYHVVTILRKIKVQFPLFLVLKNNLILNRIPKRTYVVTILSKIRVQFPLFLLSKNNPY